MRFFLLMLALAIALLLECIPAFLISWAFAWPFIKALGLTCAVQLMLPGRERVKVEVKR